MTVPSESRSTATHFPPPQPMPFFGRGKEVADLGQRLADPDCRLLTLVGPGGIGKTRLATQVQAGQGETFSDGAHFVSLESVDTVDFLISAIADALGFPLRGQRAPRSQLFDYLQDKELLLLLDNFEQLLEEGGATLLTGILETAPGIKLLVTSREVLNLRQEWVYPVHGLDYPPEGAGVEDVETYSAVQLFVERARRARHDFSLHDEQAGVVQICRLVQGMPLALELAAAWTPTMRCAAIAAEIEDNLNFLATRLRDVPERHRSVQAVFDQSWELLGEKEQVIFGRLSVFGGGFRRDAAEWVTGASLAVLSALVDKSLLRWTPDGRYRLHELLRQYAGERLGESSQAVDEAHDRHGVYYADFLHRRLEDVTGGRQRKALDEIEVELENIRAAWRWAVAHLQVKEIEKATYPLSTFHQFRGRYLEALRLLEAAAARLEETSLTPQAARALIGVLVEVGWLQIRSGRLQEAGATVAQCRELYEQFDLAPLPGQATDPALAQGVLATIRGDYAEAALLGEQARQTSEAQGHPLNRQFAYWLLARAALSQGEYETARQHAERAHTITQETGDRWFSAYCFNALGNVASAQGHYEVAKKHYAASYEIREQFNDPEGMAVALNHRGKVALQQGAPAEAQRLYRQSRDIYREISDQGGLAAALEGLGKAAVALDDAATARRYFRRALEIAADIRFVPLILSLLVGVGRLLLQTGHQERGLALLALALSHSSSGQGTQAQAREALERFQGRLSPERVAEATQRGRDSDLQTVVRTLQTELADLTFPGTESPSPPLVEPLTPRESDVLTLIAEGLSNQEIAKELILAVSTVKWYASQIYQKLDVDNRTQAAARARELNLLD